MTRLDYALHLASLGFWVFPLRVNGKTPTSKGWQEQATRDLETIRSIWKNRDYNIGIYTSKFLDNQALVVIDVDNKKGKAGDDELFRLELEGFELPGTREHGTPSGGHHIIYRCDRPLRQGADVLGRGLDIRSRGGYIVAPGSRVEAGVYTVERDHHPAPAPAWLEARLGVDDRSGPVVSVLAGIDPDRAVARGTDWLKGQRGADLGSRGSTAYRLAARLKDFGCTAFDTYELMLDWADRCDPPMPQADLAESVDHAYRYGKQPMGSAAPEAVFQEPVQPAAESATLHPFDKMNQEFAFIKKGAFVLQETTDPKGKFTTEQLSQTELHGWFANVPWESGKKKTTISQAWMEWPNRRQYEGVVFMPQQNPGSRWYNLWRGFNVQPADTSDHPSVRLFLEHALENVCGGDPGLCNWLLGYFAHMVQRPFEKPLVALVFKGRKGTGKNALVERVGALFSNHFLVADDDRYLLSNFNSHLESNLFFVLDEAAWAGDKKAESKLKGLITGSFHNIERKGREPYRVENLTRVAIIGNEDWLVPATQDERRFAVFNVGERRMQDREFFTSMRVGMEQGGYACLLRYLIDFDLSQVDVNDAPKTEALLEQKHASLDLFDQWWLDCLASEQIAGGDWAGEWPEHIPTNRLRDALARWARARNIRSRLPEEIGFGRMLAKVAPSFRKKKVRAEVKGDTSYAYFHPGLDQLRQDWEEYIGGKVTWPTT